MRKFTTLISLFFCYVMSYGQSGNVKEKFSNIQLQRIKNGVCENYDFLRQTKGKITIIEFWETWCSPCIQAMWHLKGLKSKFPNSLEVVCVSSDKFDKTVDFIAKGDFQFDFVYDSIRLLSKIFPHSGIPHTIVVDKQGQIQTETYIGYVTEEVLTALNNDNQVNLPTKKNFNPSELDNKQYTNSLIKFVLQRGELGDRNYIENISMKDLPVKIVTGYSGSSFKDTLEDINECVIAGKNALQIYQYAYGNIPLTRFVYDKNLNYLNSAEPNFVYRLNFSCSNLLGDYKEILINQLNSLWGLNTKLIEKQLTYYELVGINVKKDTIMAMPDATIKVDGTTFQSSKELKTSKIFSAESIAALIEEQIVYLQKNKYWNQTDKKIYYPVITKLTGEFALDLTINDESSSVDKWIELLAQNGLNLVKKKGKIKYVRIDRKP